MMIIKAVIFDGDGVTITGEMFSAYLQRVHGIPTTTTFPFFNGIFKKCLVGKADLKKEIQVYLKTWDWKGTIDEFLKCWFESEHSINKKIIDIISKLRQKGIKCYLATNQEKYRTEYIKKEMGFDKIFDGIFSSAYLGYKKPDEQFFEIVYNKIKSEIPVEKNQVMLWDDRQDTVNKANNFGFKAFLYTNFEDFEEIIKKLFNFNKNVTEINENSDNNLNLNNQLTKN